MMEKELSSNKLHIFLNLGPDSFKLWTQESIISLLGHIEIVDPNTGSIIQIPPEKMSLLYHKNAVTGQVELIIDYDKLNIEDSQLKLNIRPDQTNFTALRDLSTQTDLLMKFNSQSNGFYLYDYSPETYKIQSLIDTLSRIIGVLSLILAVLGFIMPAGKLIVLEMLAVIQIGYFSLLGFEKIPPIFVGLKSLHMSNGYNDLNLFSSESRLPQDIFRIMGFETVALENYNLSFIVFVMLPLIVGLIGYIAKSKGKNRVYNAFD